MLLHDQRNKALGNVVGSSVARSARDLLVHQDLRRAGTDEDVEYLRNPLDEEGEEIVKQITRQRNPINLFIKCTVQHTRGIANRKRLSTASKEQIMIHHRQSGFTRGTAGTSNLVIRVLNQRGGFKEIYRFAGGGGASIEGRAAGMLPLTIVRT